MIAATNDQGSSTKGKAHGQNITVMATPYPLV